VRGATEAINLVAQSWGASLKAGDRILLSRLEHHSNIVPWQLLADAPGLAIDVAPLTPDGRIDLDAVAAMLTPAHKLVSLAMSRTSSARCSTPAAPPTSPMGSAPSSCSTGARRCPR
jgi:selenocysteine lyase/cysteine desulfurase